MNLDVFCTVTELFRLETVCKPNTDIFYGLYQTRELENVGFKQT